MIGTNNMADHSKHLAEDDANAVTAIVKTIELATRRMPNTQILALGILPRGDADAMARVESINRRVAERLAKENLPNVTYANIDKIFENRNGSRNRGLYANSLHLNEDGYALLADTIAERVKPLLHK
jgi:lysophospholipase L1-like esterase